MDKYSINIGAGIHNEENRSGPKRQNYENWHESIYMVCICIP
jgi:hypothetical protein